LGSTILPKVGLMILPSDPLAYTPTSVSSVWI
jgi:hypothetical protein